MTTLKVFFASDIHGSEMCFRKFINAAKFYGANVLVLGGDLTGKKIIPIVKQGATYRAEYVGSNVECSTQDELKQLIKNARNYGYYPYVTSEEEYRDLSTNEKKQEALFSTLMRDSITRWLEFADERLQGSGIKCYLMGGNDDPLVIEDLLGQSACVENVESKTVRLNDTFQMVSTGYTTISPWYGPREVPEDELFSRLRNLTSRLSSYEYVIYNFHEPPYKTGIDEAPKLDPDKTVVSQGGETVMVPVGSKSVRQIIEETQPMMGLHGHIHESRGKYVIGRTIGFNPGSEYTEGVLCGVMLTLNKRKGVVGYTFTTG